MIKALKSVLAIQQFGSFAKAGQHVGLSQSAISSQIKQLEQQLGFTIFDRASKKAQLTLAGEQALPTIVQIVELYDGLKHTDSVQTGSLTVGAIASVQTGLLPQALANFYQAQSKVNVIVKPAPSMELLAMLERGEIDMAIMLEPPFSLAKYWYVIEIARQPYVLIQAIQNAENSKDDKQQSKTQVIQKILTSNPVICYDKRSFGGRQVDIFMAKMNVTVHEILQMDDLEAIVAMVEQQIGVAIIPKMGLWLQRDNNIDIIELGEATFYRKLCVVMPQRQRQSRLTQAFIECLKSDK